MKPILPILALAAALSSQPARAEIPSSLVKKLKPSVVNIEVSVQHGINSERSGKHKGSGFIVDAERGIIATNRHIMGTSPSRIKIVFEDGRTAEARSWHYDFWHDFAFIEIKPGAEKLSLRQAALGDSYALKEGEDVVMIGNNDAQEYSVKFGKTANLYLCRGKRHTATIQTTFDRAGGSSGSPVFNAKGEVVAMHFSGTSTTSFELRVEYLKDALKRLLAGRAVARGDIGVDLDLMLISDAEKHFRLPKKLARDVRALREDIKYVAFVEQTIPRSPAFTFLQAGDIILKTEGRWIGDNLYLFDKLVDSRVGGDAGLMIVRNGEVRELRLPVRDAERQKVRTFALFAGGVLHDLTPRQRNDYHIQSEGVFLSQAKKGTSMAGLGREGSHTKYLLVIQGINGKPILDLRSLIDVVKGFKDSDHIYVVVEDRWVTASSPRAHPVRLDLQYYPLRVFDWSGKKREWIERKSPSASPG